MQSAHVRRAELFRTKELLCECPRCSVRGDDTRRFPCTAKCGGHHLVHQPIDADEATLICCSGCEAAPLAAYAASQLERESATAAELRSINETIDSGRHMNVDVVPLILRLKVPQPQHRLAAEVAFVKWELAKNRQDWRSAVKAKKAEIECRDAMPSRDTAFCYEHLGDALAEHARASTAGQDAALLREAQDAYQRAVRGLMVVLGPEHPWTKVAATKLAAAQARMPRPAAAATVPAACALWRGAAGWPGTLAVWSVLAGLLLLCRAPAHPL
ncbi:hypothetical protein FOA52_009107 [Chlamydomonas sp. UWO 241]|nr:hypothetical protein FOA52_009107 [Chlamydomonas sp. UWO 241]